MRLDKTLSILYGELINTPYISAFSSVTSNISRISSGCLFFLQNPNDLQEAIKLGVYGVVFEGNIEILDSEIAWIKVDSVAQSIKRFVRYLLLKSQITLLMLTPIELSLAESIDDIFLIIQGNDICNLLDCAFNIYRQTLSNNTLAQHYILTCIQALEEIDIPKIYSYQYTRRIKIDNDLFKKPTIIYTPNNYLQKFNIISYSLFETKATYCDIAYTLNIPYILLPFLESLIALLNYSYTLLYHTCHPNAISQTNMLFNTTNGLFHSYNLKSIRFKILESCFIDSCGRFSTTQKEKTAIFCPNPTLLDFSTIRLTDYSYNKDIAQKMERILSALKTQKDSNILTEYLKMCATHLQILVCYPKAHNTNKTTPQCISVPYAHSHHLHQILIKIHFNLAIVYGISKHAFNKDISQTQQEKKLHESKQYNYGENTSRSLFDT